MVVMRLFINLLYMLLFSVGLLAQQFITPVKQPGAFMLLPATGLSIYADSQDDWLVNKAATLLQSDIEMITGKKPALINNLAAATQYTIVIGTVEGSSAIKQLAEKVLDIYS